MMWLTWRQYRKQALYTLIALAVLAAVMVPTGLAMHHTFTHSGLAACLKKLGTAATTSGDNQHCDALGQQFSNEYNGMTFIGILFVLLPVLVGLFFGAPLVAREVEQGTHRLVWTQGITRRHWALTKFGVLGGVAVVLAAAYALGMTWWFAPIVQNGGGRLGPISFDVQGIAPIGYTLFAVALGVFVGTMLPKLVPAMGITLGGYVAVRVLVEALARPRFMAPETLRIAADSGKQINENSGAWIYSQGIVNANGKMVQPNGGIYCQPAPGGGHVGGCGNELVSQGLGPAPFSNQIVYQPGSRFWAFQSIETGVFVALTILLVYLAIRRVRRIS
jgi:ABC-2 family transporter